MVVAATADADCLELVAFAAADEAVVSRCLTAHCIVCGACSVRCPPEQFTNHITTYFMQLMILLSHQTND